MKQRARIAKVARKTSRTKLSYTIAELVDASGINRSAIYRAIASGDLKSFKLGRRRMFTDWAAREFLELLERRTAGVE